MRVKLIAEHEEWLELDLEPPPGMERKPHLGAWRVRRRASDGLLLLKLSKGCGIWRADGSLEAFYPKGAELAFAGTNLFLLQNRFGPCREGRGVGHELQKLDVSAVAAREVSVDAGRPGRAAFRVSSTIELCVPTGGVNYLDIASDGRTALASWLDQSEWGYVLVDLQTEVQTGAAAAWPNPNVSPPAFSPDGQYVVSCQFERAAWWNDETDDPSEVPSPGGRRRIGTVSVHYLATNQVTDTEVFAELPAGWIPDRPYNSEWYRIWGPEFIDRTRFKIWLPDGTEEQLSLPLPTDVTISRTLGTVRQWLD